MVIIKKLIKLLHFLFLSLLLSKIFTSAQLKNPLCGSIDNALLMINEIMPSNVAAVPEGDAFPDWVELYNREPP